MKGEGSAGLRPARCAWKFLLEGGHGIRARAKRTGRSPVLRTESPYHANPKHYPESMLTGHGFGGRTERKRGAKSPGQPTLR